MDTLLLCDAATRDAQTGKWSLGGIFDAVWADSFPATHRSFDVYFRVHLGGAGALRLRCWTPDGSLEDLAALETNAPPRGIVEGAVHVPELALPAEGAYRIDLATGERVLAETTLTAGRLRPSDSSLH